jgi:AraC family ethanolamine operon transcriptional activator
MKNKSGQPLLAPQIYKFSDVDEFRSAVRNLAVDFTPLVRTISAEQIILNLPGCSVNLIKSFPRITDGQFAPDCTCVGFTMDEGFPIRFNGVDEVQSAIVLGSNGAAYTTVERVGRQYASIVFTPQVDDRGWPNAGPNFRVFETSPWAYGWLRALVWEVMSVSSAETGVEARQISAGIRESLLVGIDAAFIDLVPSKWSARANTLRQFRIFKDIREVLASSISHPIYSSDLARELGVSVRTIHDAVLDYSGMSLHRYLRQRRLWLVRQKLRGGTQSVKAAALAFGFWHLGDFAQSYRALFGETPSETLARARGG